MKFDETAMDMMDEMNKMTESRSRDIWSHHGHDHTDHCLFTFTVLPVPLHPIKFG
jgi:hypothetical protein